MIILLSGASHTGKTLLAQKLLKVLHYPSFSIDLLKMSLIKTKQTKLKATEDKKLAKYLKPILIALIKTAIENKQKLIIEGGYIPHNYQKYFSKKERKQIVFLSLIMSKNYLKKHSKNIHKFANIIEKRKTCDFTLKEAFKANARELKLCKKYKLDYVLIKKDYKNIKQKALKILDKKLKP